MTEIHLELEALDIKRDVIARKLIQELDENIVPVAPAPRINDMNMHIMPREPSTRLIREGFRFSNDTDFIYKVLISALYGICIVVVGLGGVVLMVCSIILMTR